MRQQDPTEFNEWFDDSKIVDTDGKPRVVYRAIEEGQQLRPHPGTCMIHVALAREMAQVFAIEGRTVKEAYVRANKPFDYRNHADLAWLVPVMTAPENIALFNKQTKEIMGADYNHEIEAPDLLAGLQEGLYQIYEVPVVFNLIRAHGYDAIYMREDVQPSQYEPNLAVFDTSQIRIIEQSEEAQEPRPRRPKPC